ncbi:hypothetical protein [Nostoc sp.]|uniref:hypothetical protein n=1 Tax=Nostoc sp. TaxID=1180 RepID=UPI002FF64B06
MGRAFTNSKFSILTPGLLLSLRQSPFPMSDLDGEVWTIVKQFWICDRAASRREAGSLRQAAPCLR